MAIPEQQLGDLSFRGVMLLGAYYITEKGYLTLVRYPFNFSQPLCGLRAVRG